MPSRTASAVSNAACSLVSAAPVSRRTLCSSSPMGRLPETKRGAPTIRRAPHPSPIPLGPYARSSPFVAMHFWYHANESLR